MVHKLLVGLHRAQAVLDEVCRGVSAFQLTALGAMTESHVQPPEMWRS